MAHTSSMPSTDNAIEEVEKASYLNPVLGTLAILAVVMVAVLSVRAWEVEKQIKDFNAAAGTFRQLVEGRMLAIRFELESTKRFFQGSSFVNRDEFRSFVTEPIDAFPEILDMVWVVRLPVEDREALEKTAWEEGLGGQSIFRVTGTGAHVASDSLPLGKVYYPVVYAEPEQRLGSLVGLDVSTRDSGAALIDQVQASRQLTSSMGVRLWPKHDNDPPHQKSTLSLAQPVFRGQQLDAKSPDDLMGILITQVDISALFEEAFSGQDSNRLSLYLVNDREGNAGADIVYHHEIGHSEHGEPDHLHGLSTTDFLYNAKLDVLGNPWTLSIVPMAGFFESNRHYQSWGALVFGVLFTAMSSFLLVANKRQTDIIREKVRLQTREISSANTTLEKEVERRHAQLRELRFLENAIDEHAIVSSTDAQGDITYVNEKFCQISGYTQEELIGRNPRILGSGEHDAAFFDHLWQTISSGVVWQGDLKNINKQGEPYWVRTTIVPNVNEHGVPFRYFSICTEITENITLETQLRASKQEAEMANQAKSEFLSSMSHELRTPLNAILGFAQMLEYNPQEPLLAGQKESVDLITKGGRHLLELINEVLDLAKIETGKVEMSIEPVRVKEVMDECLSLIDAMAQDQGIEVHVGSGCDEPIYVLADYLRFKQVLLNLMSNAVKYNRPNGRIDVDCAMATAGSVIISVSDTGTGIPADKLDHLFSPFTRLGAENSEIEGTGIGLTITKQLVERMGGGIAVDTQEGQGSTFSVTLPQGADRMQNMDLDGLNEEVVAKQLPDISGTVLYVEDNPANLKLMEMVVEHIGGLHLLTAHNAELGLELAKLKLPDLIILDINLPGMDGFAALKKLKSAPETQAIPVIALSANAMTRDVQKGMLAGFRFYLTKPIRVDELVNVFEVILQPKA